MQVFRSVPLNHTLSSLSKKCIVILKNCDACIQPIWLVSSLAKNTSGKSTQRTLRSNKIKLLIMKAGFKKYHSKNKEKL